MQGKVTVVSAQECEMREASHWLSAAVRGSECPRLPQVIIDSSVRGECKMKRAVMYFSTRPIRQEVCRIPNGSLYPPPTSTPPPHSLFSDSARVFFHWQLLSQPQTLQPGTAHSQSHHVSSIQPHTLVIIAHIE